MKSRLRLIKRVAALVPEALLGVCLLLLGIVYFIVNLFRDRPEKPRLLLGADPLINIKYWSQSAVHAGYDSTTFVFKPYAINQHSDFDIVFKPHIRIHILKVAMAYVHAMRHYDILMFSYRGAFCAGLPILTRIEPYLFKLCGKKTIAYPYGSDAYVYRRIRDMSMQNALQISYPLAARRQASIAANVARWTRHADCVMPGFMIVDGIGRWDLVLASYLVIDEKKWTMTPRRGMKDIVTIAHTPNHRGGKGTEFIVEAVEILKREGLPVNLVLLEGLPNEEVRRFLSEEADILVEQLIMPGHGLSALEGMACGIPVISNLANDNYTLVFRRYSFFGECPIVSATPETIAETLRTLVIDADLRGKLGRAGRQYVEKYHSYEMGAYMFDMIVRKIWVGEDIDLMNLFHPLLGEYPKRKPRIEHPLVENRIVR